MINGHGGNIYDLAKKTGCLPSEIIDMSSNVNPVGPVPGLMTFLEKNILSITALPEVDSKKAVDAFAVRYDVDPRLVLSANGTTQFIYSMPKALETKKALIFGPTYADYADACIMHDVDFSCITAEESLNFKPDIDRFKRQIKDSGKTADTVFICNPNNPTGVMTPIDELESLCSLYPEINFVIDESYLPFVDNGDKSMIYSGLSNVIVLNSMSKIFHIPGLRIGFLVSSKKNIEKFVRYTLPWSVNSLAQAAVSFLMEQRTVVDNFVKETRTFLDHEKKLFGKRLKNVSGIKLFPSATSFILAKLTGRLTAHDVCDQMAQDRILIRNCANFKGLSDRFIRISLKTSETNRMAADKLLKILF